MTTTTARYRAQGGVGAFWLSMIRYASGELEDYPDQVLIEGPAGCVAGETELWDPIAKVGRRIDQLCWAKERPWVETLDGPELAETPFLKGFSVLYRVEFEDGASFLGTADHKCLTTSGYVRVDQLAPGVSAVMRMLDDGFRCVPVMSIRAERTDVYYDLTVPKAGHYVANGIVHKNTGKTRGICEFSLRAARKFPGARILWARYTRESLRQSILVTFEEKVLPVHPEMAYLAKGATRGTRMSYRLNNGSEIAIAGLQPTQVGNTYSTEWDIVVVFECWEVPFGSWQKLTRAIRNEITPWQVAIADTNPADPFHYLNQLWPVKGLRRCPKSWPERRVDEAGEELDLKARFLSRHEDNPACTPEYLRKLRSMKGHDRERLYEGKWAGATGRVIPQFNAEAHLIPLCDADDTHHARHKGGWLVLEYFVISMDFGYAHAGSLIVWGVAPNGIAYAVAEVYRARMPKNWWADRFLDLVMEFKVIRAVADSAEPDTIHAFNDVLAGKGLPRFLRPVAKVSAKGSGRGEGFWKTSVDILRDALLVDPITTHARLYVGEDINRFGIDEQLSGEGRPTGLAEELLALVYPLREDGKSITEKPDPACADDAVDAARYFCVTMWNRDLTPRPEPESWGPYTFGAVLGHNELDGFQPKTDKKKRRPWGTA